MFDRTRGEHINYYTTDEPMIDRTRGEHINYYTTDAIKNPRDVLS
jgi:hypothetical protein